MGQLLQAYHLLATAIFWIGSLVVAVRLLRLSRRSQQKPELFLGLGILGTAVLGYGLLVGALLLRGGDMLAPASPTGTLLSASGQILHNAGLTMILLFVLAVFRPGVRWAKLLAGAMLIALWGGCAGVALEGGFTTIQAGTPAWLTQYAVVWLYPLWSMVESFRYYAMMRRRRALGLADPLIVNRFCLWGIASALTALATWIACIPFALIHDAALLAAWTPGIYISTATVGLVTIGCYSLTFFPPARYVSWLRGDQAAAETAG